MDPAAALAAGILVLGVAAALLWPGKGVLAHLERVRRSDLRVRMEDALKHLYDCEYRRLPATRQSVSGALGIGPDEAARLLGRLETLALARREGEAFGLTSGGRSYALRIIRVHRLWERWLADETGVGETEWHSRAEDQEHRLSQGDADALAARLGHPPYDPHGDPIPTSAGEIPSARGRPLADMHPGDGVRVVHVEDEPAAVYAQIAAQGIRPGASLRVLESSAQRVRFILEGEELVLAPIVASNLTVVPLQEDAPPARAWKTLDELAPGESGRVVSISRACRKSQRRRLMDLGLVPGTLVRSQMEAPGGDPVAYEVRGAVIALRRAQASMIGLEPGGEKG
ncbi:MAG: FeoA domain-containing protein [Bacteroidota bacterium]